MTLIETKRAQLAGRIAGLNVPTGQHKARQAALTRLNAMGMPNKRDEYWRYTDPADLIGALALPVTGGEARDAAPMFDKLDALKIVFVDGVLDRDASDDLAMAGVRITLLSGADTASDLYGVLEETGQNPVARPLASFNTAFATEGVLIHVLKPVRRPVSIIYTSKTATSDAILHHCIKVDPGASLTLLEAGTLAARANLVLEVDLGEGAALHHIRDQGTGHLRQLVTHIFARLDRKALFKSFTLTTNGRLTRNEAVIDLLGDDGQAHLAGAALGDGPFHHDDTVFVTHGALRGESRQVFKKVLKNGALGVFQGKILVRPGAQRTDGYQLSQGLLLDEGSQFLAKPELEIYADDVKCSHGSTCGAIDETALFYLRSRGVTRTEAQALLVLAFLAQAIVEIDDPVIAEEVRAGLENWLAGHKG